MTTTRQVHNHYRLPSVAFLILNSLGLALALWGITAIFERPLPVQLQDAGHLQFLTNLSLLLTIGAMLSNYLVIGSSNPAILKVNTVFNAGALVCETLVALIYWTLKLFFMKLIVPENVPREMYIPMKLDLTIHLFPVTFLSMDYYMNRTDSFRLPLLFVVTIVFSLTGGYWYILESLVKPPAHYPYPFLNVELEERAKIFTVVALLGLVFYEGYESIHSILKKNLWGIKHKAE